MAIGARESQARLDTVSAKPLKEVFVFGSSIPQGVINTIKMLRKANAAADGGSPSRPGDAGTPPPGVAKRRQEEFFRKIE